jgi:putative phosphoesterase
MNMNTRKPSPSPSSQWRIGLISDLHGNLVATQTALAALDALGVDQLVCLGDVATTGPNPRETVAALRDLGCPVVMGNTDAWALDPHPFEYRNPDTPIVYVIELWGAQQLEANDRAFIQSFAPSVRLELGATSVLCYHGSPRSYLEDIRATTPDAELDEIFTDHIATVAIGGHTHTQMVRRHRDLLIVNPGSVGMPTEQARGATKRHYPPWTEFGVLEVAETPAGPSLHVELHRVPTDVDAVIHAAHTSGMPHVAWYVDFWQRG